MNIIVLHGSPRKGGDSDTLAQTFLDEMRKHRDCAIKHFYLNDMKIAPCQGCQSCCETQKCRIVDDMQQIYDAFPEADIVVWATPMYWGYMTAQMKLALDRMEALVCADGWKDKVFAVFLTYHCHVQSTVNFFERVCPFFETELHIVTCHTIKDNEHVPAAEMPGKLKECRELAFRLSEA